MVRVLGLVLLCVGFREGGERRGERRRGMKGRWVSYKVVRASRTASTENRNLGRLGQSETGQRETEKGQSTSLIHKR